MNIQVVSHGITMQPGIGTLDHRRIETFAGESIIFRSSDGHPIESVIVAGEAVPRVGVDYALTTPKPGEYEVTFCAASGHQATVIVTAVPEKILNRIPLDGVKTRSAYRDKCRPIIRSLLRHGHITARGELADDANPSAFGASAYGLRFADLRE